MALMRMTKTEFTQQARKAGVAPELYGAVLAHRFHGPDGDVHGGKVVGIAWMDGWNTEKRYSPAVGSYEATFMDKFPYVVLRKDRKDYRVEAFRVNGHVSGLMHAWLAEQVREGRPL